MWGLLVVRDLVCIIYCNKVNLSDTLDCLWIHVSPAGGKATDVALLPSPKANSRCKFGIRSK